MKVQETWSGESFTVVGVTDASPSAAERFEEQLETNYPILADAAEAFDGWGIVSIPASFLVNPSGEIVADDLAEIDGILDREL